MSPAAKKKRAEMAANLQWLCRLFLETREQIFTLHEGMPTEDAVCDGLRDELDVVQFRRTLEVALSVKEGDPPPRRLIRKLRAAARRALHGRKCNAYGRQVYERFVASCSGHGDSCAFVMGAVPRVLQLIAKIVEDDRQALDAGAECPGSASEETVDAEDPWADSDTEDTSARVGGVATEPLFPEEDEASTGQLEQEADAFLADAAQSPDGDDSDEDRPHIRPGADAHRSSASQRQAPGREAQSPPEGLRGPSTPVGSAADANASEQRWDNAPRMQPAHPPYISGDKALLTKVAKSPLPNLEGLVDVLVPGAEITTEGLLVQLADDELVTLAYALEQITEAASKRLIKELETRDELRSTCMHRREYLQLIDGALGNY